MGVMSDYDPAALDDFLGNHPDLEQAERDAEKAGQLNRYLREGDITGFAAALNEALETPAVTYDILTGTKDQTNLGEIWATNFGPVLEKYLEDVTKVANLILWSERLLKGLPTKVKFVLVDVLFEYFEPESWNGWRGVLRRAGHKPGWINALVMRRLRCIADDENLEYKPEDHMPFLEMFVEPARDVRSSYRPFDSVEEEAEVIAILRRFLPDRADDIDQAERRMRFSRTYSPRLRHSH